jgi:hypothetical protein
MNINRSLAAKVLEVVDAGLVKGLGTPEPGKMCVEAAVNYALGADHGDKPACVAPALRALKIRLNDASWSSEATRAKGLRRLAIAQLGSKDALDEKEFAKRVATLAIRLCVPEALRAAAGVLQSPHKEQLLKWAFSCEQEPTRKNALGARGAANAADADAAYDAAAADADAAYDAAAAYAASAAADAAYADAAAYDAASAAYASAAASAAYASAAYASAAAADAASAAAYDAADAAADAAYAYAAAVDTRDQSLTAFAECVVQILIEMKAPGCEFLDLAPLDWSAA